jgi:hypothetical protein
MQLDGKKSSAQVENGDITAPTTNPPFEGRGKPRKEAEKTAKEWRKPRKGAGKAAARVQASANVEVLLCSWHTLFTAAVSIFQQLGTPPSSAGTDYSEIVSAF